MGSIISKSLNRFCSSASSIVNDGGFIRYAMCAWLSSSDVFALFNADGIVVVVLVGVCDGEFLVLDKKKKMKVI